ncbi:synapse-associated protein 1 isoform X2 [Agrilus planipennis]|uniref:Synapse-associated protein 1 isoform X2 n=1 Tax=Agrilus planipennis TaxID=224129 RepID=A0A7F5REP9_AGRPL|nr:synapse-associated protein 1 isoform X2 [Agrilus planipennis]
MFSGLTNQVSSWMGSVKGDQEEKVPTPTEENTSIDTAAPEKKDISPTKAGKLDMFSNVKSQIGGIGGWLGSNIPKFRNKEGEEQDPNDPHQYQPVGDAEAPSDIVNVQKKDEDDDNSSATGGADSAPQSVPESPTEDKDGQFGNVQSKAIAGAKSFGSFLYSAVNKAGKTVSEAGAKIKKTVEENSILGEFNKEQEAFVKQQQQGDASSALPPWVGSPNEESLKEECLSLSTDRRNFLRSPPAGVDFHFDYDISYPVAMAIMEQDPNLEKMRFELVPKVISEENFWRNYFYRVSLTCQANELNMMSREGENQPGTETVTSGQPIEKTEKSQGSHEFVSDTLQTSSKDLVEVQEGMKKLTLGSKIKEEDWEKELEAELQDYEVVSENKSANSKNDNWEQEIEEMLEENGDVK